MLTPTTIDRLDKINDFLVSFQTLVTDIGTVDPYLTNASTFTDLAVKELTLDALKRN